MFKLFHRPKKEVKPIYFIRNKVIYDSSQFTLVDSWKSYVFYHDEDILGEFWLYKTKNNRYVFVEILDGLDKNYRVFNHDNIYPILEQHQRIETIKKLFTTEEA